VRAYRYNIEALSSQYIILSSSHTVRQLNLAHREVQEARLREANYRDRLKETIEELRLTKAELYVTFIRCIDQWMSHGLAKR
jgi:hypothetical protein